MLDGMEAAFRHGETSLTDLLETVRSVAELELDAEEVGGLIPEPFSDDPSLGPVVQSQTAVAPLPPRPNPPRPSLDDRFAADLPRDARGFAPAIDTAAPSIPSFGDARMASEASAVPARSGRGRFLMLMLAVPALAALVVAGWPGVRISTPTDPLFGGCRPAEGEVVFGLFSQRPPVADLEPAGEVVHPITGSTVRLAGRWPAEPGGGADAVVPTRVDGDDDDGNGGPGRQ